jgi:hypothetical protein
MLGFVIGTLSLLGLAKVISHGHHGRWRHSYAGGCGGGGCGYGHSQDYGDEEGGGPRGYGRRGFGRRWALRWLFERLDTTPGQEKVIFAAVEEIESTVKKHRIDFEHSFSDLANAVRSAEYDQTQIAEAWIKHDRGLEAIRLAISTQLGLIHEALDERQRKIVADLIESGPSWRGRFGGGRRHRHASWGRSYGYASAPSEEPAPKSDEPDRFESI